MTEELISLREAAKCGFKRLRLPIWTSQLDHVKIDIVGDQLGPWAHLYSPMNLSMNGRDPFDLLIATQISDYDEKEWVVYDGPLPDSTTYLEAQAAFGIDFGGDA